MGMYKSVSDELVSWAAVIGEWVFLGEGGVRGWILGRGGGTEKVDFGEKKGLGKWIFF